MKTIDESPKRNLLPSHVIKEYNDDGSLRKILYGPHLYVEYEYDCCGNKTMMSQYNDGDISVKEWLYDECNLVKEVKQDGAVIVRYEYTEHGNISRLTYPRSDGRDLVIRYIYDNDHSGRVAEIIDETDKKPKLIRKYEYNDDGILSRMLDYRGFDLDNITEQSLSFDSEGKLLSFSYTDMTLDGSGNLGSSVLRERYDLMYDHAGNITNDTSYTDYGVPITVAREYEYDASNRLTREMVNSQTIAEYTFDPIGNRKSLTTNTCALYYDYNASNELTRIARDTNFTNLVTTFTYDDRGNQTTETDVATSTVTTYEYDLADRLVKVARRVGNDPAATLATYWYDGDGQRVKKVIGGTTTRYYYDGLKLLYTDDGSQRLEETIMEPDGKLFAVKRVAGKHANNYYFLRKDVRGSITKVVDENGDAVAGFDYDAYGRTMKTGDACLTLSLAYTGAVYDEETGLYYMNARYYDPKIGRFLTRDTVEGQLAYTYCEGNPVNRTDTTGHCPNVNCLLFGVYTGLRKCPYCKGPEYLFRPLYKLMGHKYNLGKEKFDTVYDNLGILAPHTKKYNNQIYYYCQGDYLFRYGTDSNPNNFKNNGCFPSCLAMVASTYENKYFTPAWIVNQQKNPFDGNENKNEKWSFKNINNTFSKYFMYKDVIVTQSSKDLEYYLKKGYLAIKHQYWYYDKVKKKKSSGHFVVIGGINLGGDNWKYFLYDPGYKNQVNIPINLKSDADKKINQKIITYTDPKTQKTWTETCWRAGEARWHLNNFYIIPREYK